MQLSLKHEWVCETSNCDEHWNKFVRHPLPVNKENQKTIKFSIENRKYLRVK